jgi:hypothetical protein
MGGRRRYSMPVSRSRMRIRFKDPGWPRFWRIAPRSRSSRASSRRSATAHGRGPFSMRGVRRPRFRNRSRTRSGRRGKMGTSQSSDGPGPGVPMVPPWTPARASGARAAPAPRPPPESRMRRLATHPPTAFRPRLPQRHFPPFSRRLSRPKSVSAASARVSETSRDPETVAI